jgi:hypothetical protein
MRKEAEAMLQTQSLRIHKTDKTATARLFGCAVPGIYGSGRAESSEAEGSSLNRMEARQEGAANEPMLKSQSLRMLSMDEQDELVVSQRETVRAFVCLHRVPSSL